MRSAFLIASMAFSMTAMSGADHPTASIANDQVKARIYLPDPDRGFYRGTRFDWSGVIYSLQAGGHDYYGPWFTKTSPSVHDFVYEGPDIVAGPCSAITGPVDEFAPVGWDSAARGGTFIKIGVGALRKPDDQPYDNYRLYEVADHGKWQVQPQADGIEFIQTVADAGSGFGYVYQKTIRLTRGKSEMMLQHSIRNTGSHAIRTKVYNHNFLVLDGKPTGDGFVISVPFPIRSPEPPPSQLAEIRGNEIRYLRVLKGHDTVATPIEGFGQRPSDNSVRIENKSLGAGMSFETDRPLLSASLWSIRSVIAVEPFIAISIDPGQEFSWSSVYRYYSLSSAQ